MSEPEEEEQSLDPELLSLVQPLDEFNQELLDRVYPCDCATTEPLDRYHLVVIGGGTAGLVSAVGAAGLGARVAMIEERLLGGDCLNYGCVPSKALIRASRAWDEARRAHERFGGPEVVGPGDFSLVMQRMRRLRAQISHNDSGRRCQSLGVDVLLGHGRFLDSSTIDVDGKRLKFRRAIIATGTRPVCPPIPGCVEGSYLTNESIFTLTELPPRFGVIGGGPIGCELAQAFARFGSKVTLFELQPRLLDREDEDAAAIVQRALERDGVALELGVEISRIETTSEGTIVHFLRQGRAQQLVVDELLVAVGRAPNLEGLGLQEAGIQTDKNGIKVNDRLQTTNRRVFAVGDVVSQYKFTHVADAQARIAIQNSLFFGRAKVSDLVVPWCTYTSPEVAHVGLYERQARKLGYEVDTLTVPMSDVDRAVLDDAEEGFLRLHLQKGKDRILGATMVAEHAGELLDASILATTAGVGLNQIANTIFPYPTQAEVLKKAADAWRRGRLTPIVRRIFGTFFRIFA